MPELRVLPPRPLGATSPAPQPEQATTNTPLKTRDDASAGYHRALVATQANRHPAPANAVIAAAVERQGQALLACREPEAAFAQAVAQAEQDERAARAAASTSSQALAERRARADKAVRAGAIPLHTARRPSPTSGAA
ncbi:hypothetical protein [Kitasatospora acidiphila]|uniref:hypothetical protein n=1 Tax=Kitasatospora acidiphila TaxID=2567942 RepID=UPI003C708BE3